jgi:pescadillo protein
MPATSTSLTKPARGLLFGSLVLVRIHAYRVANCKRLMQEFQYYIIKTNALRKVFISVKGIYYQVEVMGQTITWLAPFQFVQPVSLEHFLCFCDFYFSHLRFRQMKRLIIK